MANSVDPGEMACNKPSHLDQHCLQNYLLRSALKRLSFETPVTAAAD